MSIAKRSDQEVEKCTVCGVDRDKKNAKYWRKDRCNKCYAKAQREKRKKAKEENGEADAPKKFVGKPKKYKNGTNQFGTSIPKETAHLFVGLSMSSGKSRTELLIEMVDRYVEEVEFSREELIAAGKIAMKRG